MIGNIFKIIPKLRPFFKKDFVFRNCSFFTNKRPQQMPSTAVLTTNEAMSKIVGTNSYLSKVYATTGLTFVSALITSYAIISNPVLREMMFPLAFSGAAVSLICYTSAYYIEPTYATETERINDQQKLQTIHSIDSPLRRALYGFGVLGFGAAFTPLIQLATTVNPIIVPSCLGLSAAIFGGASLMTYTLKNHSFPRYIGALGGSLLGLISLKLAGHGTALVMGPNIFSLMTFQQSNIIALGLMASFLLYDTFAGITMYQMGQPDLLTLGPTFSIFLWYILQQFIATNMVCAIILVIFALYSIYL